MSVEQEIEITPQIIEEHGLTQDEYARIQKILGRNPNYTELGIFSVMWSEHCSYKNSKPLLKLFPTKSPRIMIGAGEENAGVVDIGDGLGLVFKVESHNHPSAVEPYQGAATGVGGIIRDIFTMGARPIACMDSLRFGPLSNARTRFLLKGVVSGIAGYGNCMGIPTIGGEVMFDESYETNPLVNVFCLGVVKHEDIARGAASGVGNPVFYVGSTTGRDGIHGATFASDDLTEESEEKKSAVQVGDPFMEKLLLEACLEIIQKGYVLGIQDMGAAGLTCSTCETASRGKSGVAIDVAKVPQRETGMVPYEVMLSESQERMLVIVKPGHEKDVQDVFERWDLHAEQIGEVVEGQNMKVYHKGELVADIPADALADDAPVYEREEQYPSYLDEAQTLDASIFENFTDYAGALKGLLASPNIASKAWIFEQYDHMVRTNTIVLPGSDASVIRIKGTQKAVSMKLDGQGRYCYLDPYEGGKIAVAEAARNVACSGAKPIAATDCLNFGNPLNPEVFWVFRKCVEGMAEACTVLDTPIVGGNVSLYNQSDQGPIDPTPIVGVVGLIEGASDNLQDSVNTQWFQNEGDAIVLLGETFDELGGSEFLKEQFGQKKGLCPRLDLNKEQNLYALLYEASQASLLNSAHDCAEGGLAVCLAESCISNPEKVLGADVQLETDLSDLSLLFSESQSRVVVSLAQSDIQKLQNLAEKHSVPFQVIGQVGGDVLNINDLLKLDSCELQNIWKNALKEQLIPRHPAA